MQVNLINVYIAEVSNLEKEHGSGFQIYEGLFEFF